MRSGRAGGATRSPTRARSYGIFLLFLHRLRAGPELVDAAVPACAGAGAVRARDANLDPALAHPLIVERGRARPGRRAIVRELLAGREDDGARSGSAPPGAGAAAQFDDSCAHLEAREQGPRRVALGEERYRRILLEREALEHDAGRCARWARPSSTGSTPRCARSRARRDRHRGLARGLREATRTTR